MNATTLDLAGFLMLVSAAYVAYCVVRYDMQGPDRSPGIGVLSGLVAFASSTVWVMTCNNPSEPYDRLTKRIAMTVILFSIGKLVANFSVRLRLALQARDDLDEAVAARVVPPVTQELADVRAELARVMALLVEAQTPPMAYRVPEETLPSG